MFAPEVKAAHRRLLDQGWTDAVRHLHPDARIYTFCKYWRDSFECNAGLGIDHFLVNDPTTMHLTKAEVHARPRGWEKTSDHAPVWIDLADRMVRGRAADQQFPVYSTKPLQWPT